MADEVKSESLIWSCFDCPLCDGGRLLLGICPKCEGKSGVEKR